MSDRGIPLTDSERLDWLRLIRTENIGPHTFRGLLHQHGSASAALDALPEISRRGGRRQPIMPFPSAAASRELERITDLGAQLLSWADPNYPVALAAVDDAPPLLCALGETDLLNRDTVAIVGARNASALGRRMAVDLAHGLGNAGLIIASGLARGIDTAAHKAAIESGTIAVVAGGIDIVYPPENAELTARIGSNGVVVSEMPPGTRPGARHFPRRNRIISGLSRGVVVIEAAHRSGSLITARLALEQGREVFAVPGSPLDPRAEGTNRLIRDGATLTRSADDVLDVLDPMLRTFIREQIDETGCFNRTVGAEPQAAENAGDIDEQLRQKVVDLLSVSPVPVDDLVRSVGASTGAVMAILLELEIAGRLARHAGQRISLIALPDQ